LSPTCFPPKSITESCTISTHMNVYCYNSKKQILDTICFQNIVLH
jgi:hypothetical protein